MARMIAEIVPNHHYYGNLTRRWWAHPNILVGGSIYDAADWQHLVKDFHMFACVNVENEHSDNEKNIQWLLEAPAPDDGTPRTIDSFHRVFDFVNKLGRESSIYVHCQMGGSRSPAYAYAIMRAIHKMSPHDALYGLTRSEDGWRYGTHPYHTTYLNSAELAIASWGA
jgi:protein-tyrosine phosphatase